MPTAPESLPTATCSKAACSRSRLRWASKAKPASRSPNVVGSAWTPWVRPTDERVAMLERAGDQRVAIGDAPAATIGPGLRELHGEAGVEHVGGGEPVVDPAPSLADRLGDDVDERGDVVAGRRSRARRRPRP